MDHTSVITKRLLEARLAAGLSQKRLGIAAGIDEFSASPRINQYERGVHVPDYSTVERLALVLNVPTPYFYTRDDDMAKLILRYGQLDAAEKLELMKFLKLDEVTK
ncbi:helix-turn-helix transcriptional regulator [Methylotenera sp.]|uniref:helix-turn-helix domain-containing protein n=1 Tax=Methylotenera sp. TaxID=2051956 RepID=UPI002ED84E01